MSYKMKSKQGNCRHLANFDASAAPLVSRLVCVLLASPFPGQLLAKRDVIHTTGRS